MSPDQTMAALQRAAGDVTRAWAVYASVSAPAELRQARQQLEVAMDAYEQAVAAHASALLKALADPRQVVPPRGRTKGL